MFFVVAVAILPRPENRTTLQDLKDETKLQEVRDSTGLGKSQTAEVAWLDRLRIPYEEHDVGDFYRFLYYHSTLDPWHPLAIL